MNSSRIAGTNCFLFAAASWDMLSKTTKKNVKGSKNMTKGMIEALICFLECVGAAIVIWLIGWAVDKLETKYKNRKKK